MKIDLNLEPKDYIKVLVLLGAGGFTALMSKGNGSTPERMAILETKVERVQADVSDIKRMLERRRQ